MRPGFICVVACFVGAACGTSGKSDGSSSPAPSAPATPTPTATISVDRPEVAAGAVTVATWSSTNASSCTASGGWTGAKATSGTENVVVSKDASLTITCGTAANSAAVSILKPSFSLPSALFRWKPVVGDVNGDGNDEIIITTQDAVLGLYALHQPNPLYVLGVSNNRLTDLTSSLFPVVPKNYDGRVVLGDFDGNGKTDLYICDRGLQVSPNPVSSWYLTGYVTGDLIAQNQVWLQGADGKFTDYASKYPVALNMGWGCSAGDVDKSGVASIVVAGFYGAAPTFEQAYVVKWNGTQFVVTRNLVTGAYTKFGQWTETADFDKNGYADIVGVGKIRWGNASGGTETTMAPSAVEAAGYNFQRGTVVADFNGDGYPDLVRVSSFDPANANGGGSARFTLWTGGPNQTLTEQPGAFPATTTYNPSDFNYTVEAVDINFDGKLDIVSVGHVYTFNNQDREPSAVWINNGNGTFTLKHIDDELTGAFDCGTAPGGLRYQDHYVLRTTDPKVLYYTQVGCFKSLGGLGYVTRKVTPAYPLKLVP